MVKNKAVWFVFKGRVVLFKGHVVLKKSCVAFVLSCVVFVLSCVALNNRVALFECIGKRLTGRAPPEMSESC